MWIVEYEMSSGWYELPATVTDEEAALVVMVHYKFKHPDVQFRIISPE